jgi:hypothetical protein
MSFEKTWSGDWRSRIRDRVRLHGFETLTEYADDRAGVSLVVLADELGPDDIAAAQLRSMLLEGLGAGLVVERVFPPTGQAVPQLTDEEVPKKARNCSGALRLIEQDGLDLSPCDVFGAEFVSECEQRGSGAMVGIVRDCFEALVAYSLQDASVPVTGPRSLEAHESGLRGDISADWGRHPMAGNRTLGERTEARDESPRRSGRVRGSRGCRP